MGGKLNYHHNPLHVFFIDYAFYFFVTCCAGAASFFYCKSILQFKTQAEKEKSLLIKELNFLKNQFNSHITFNFLNYCYSNVHHKLPETAEAIGLFADMLRCTMQTRPDEKVSISEEIKSIENFINLKKLLNTKVYVKFSYSGETEGFYILPRILITFVENAFKHGLYNTPQYPIVINLEVNNSKMFFTVTNRVDSNIKMISTHTGLDNVKKLFYLYYAGSYELTTEEKEGIYCVSLFIDMKAGYDVSVPSGLHGQATSERLHTIPKPPSLEFSKPIIGIKSLMHINKKQIQRHIITWLLIITYFNVIDPLPGTWAIKVISTAMIDINFMFVYYSLSLYLFPKYWESKRIALFTGIFFCLLIYWVSYYSACIKMIPAIGGSTYFQQETFYYFLKATFYYFVAFASAGIASFFSRYGLYKLKQQAEKERLLLARELAFLKDQFNSHLTFNFLNYCYDSMYDSSPKTAESVGIFADMLRYTLQTGQEEKVALSKEIIYIENFISIQRLLTTQVYVDFSYDNKIGDKKILSRVLVIFVENAFKHGVLNESQNPILINLKVVDNQLNFTVKNRIKKSVRLKDPRKEENVTKILDLYYTNNYDIKKEIEDDFYCVELKMGLTDQLQFVEKAYSGN